MRIHQLVAQEHLLRQNDSAITPQHKQGRVARLEEALDQCWDLLRQRRPLREAGQDSGRASVRSVSEVEPYQQ